MAVENQTSHNNANFFLVARTKQGQRLTITDRSVSKLSFVLYRTSSATTGTVSFSIRKVSDDSLIATKVWGNAVDLPLVATWLEVTFDTPAYVNEEVRILVEGTFQLGTNLIIFRLQTTDIKASEIYTQYNGTTWNEDYAWDAPYSYTYISGGGGGGGGSIYPTDALKRVSGIKRTFWSGLGGQAVYQCELALGGMSTTYVSPIGERTPKSAVTPTPTPSGAGYQEADYLLWLRQASWDTIIKTFGHFPTYAEWVKWRQTPYFPQYF